MNIRKLIPVAVIVAGLVLVPAAAYADDVPPVVEEVAPAAEAARVAPDRLPICHSGSGKTWTFISPDASGYNGHQHHDADVHGLTEADCLGKNVVEPPVEEEPPVVVDETPFVLIAWPFATWTDEHTPSWPQGIAAGLAAPFTVDLATRNLDALDATLAAVVVPCGTSVQYQVDGNFDTVPVRGAIAGGSLYGPNNPAEALWGGGWGEAYKLVKIDGPACPPPPPVIPEPRVVVFEGEWEGVETSCTVPEVEEQRVVVTSSIPWKVILIEGLYQVVEDLENASHDTNVETRTVRYDGDPCVVPVDEEPTPEPTDTPTITPAAPQVDALAATGVEPYDGWLLGAMGAALILAGIAVVAGLHYRRRAEK